MKLTIFATVLAWLSFQSSLFQQASPTLAVSNNLQTESVFEMLRKAQPFEMSLETDFKQLKNKRNTADYQPGKLTYTDPGGNTHNLEIEVRPRGNMRRNLCDLPPLKVKFPGSHADSKTLKLVSICKESDYYEQLVLREYVAYRLYNILTEQSLRVQLVKMKFLDTGGKETPAEHYAFFIEHHDEMAQRNAGKILDEHNISMRVLNTAEYERLCLFQFMLGNTDWLAFSGHNLKVFGVPGTANPVFVPYDFDYSGFVNASYAVPDERLGLPDVTDRYYLGLSRPEEKSMETIRLFLDKKKEVMAFCEAFPFFDKKSRKHTLKYLDEFYGIIEHPKKSKRWVFGHSDKWPNP